MLRTNDILEGKNTSILIAFASKSGSSKACAEQLAKLLPESETRDLTREKPDPAAYDMVIVGGGVRMGQWHVDARQYLALFGDALLARPLGLFLCCGRDDATGTLWENNVQPELLAHAFAAASFGGEIDLQRIRGFDRFIAKAALKSAKADGSDPPRLRPDRIAAFADAATRALRSAKDSGNAAGIPDKHA